MKVVEQLYKATARKQRNDRLDQVNQNRMSQYAIEAAEMPLPIDHDEL